MSLANHNQTSLLHQLDTRQDRRVPPESFKMTLAKSKKSVGLGSMLMKDRFSKGQGNNRKHPSAIARVDRTTGEEVRRPFLF